MTLGWGGRLVNIGADEDEAIRLKAIELGLTTTMLYKAALKLAMDRWPGEDGEKLIKQDLMLYKLTEQ